MKGFFRNSTFLLLAGLLLISFSGINLYTHFCSCEDLNYVTAMPSSTCCEHEATPVECCGTVSTSPSCCSEEENNCPDGHVSKSACCTTQHLFIKLTADINIHTNQNLIKLIPFDFDNNTTEEYPTTSLSCIPLSCCVSPPLLLHGKELLNFLHQRRIDC